MNILFMIMSIMIILLLICGYALLGKIEQQRDESKKYFAELRREYDMRLEQYREDIAIRDQIIMDYRVLNGR